jgi:hypothetical protein
MNRAIPRSPPEAANKCQKEQWVRLLSNDVSGVDRDIEALVGVLQKRHRYGREKATALLVRKLSTFSDRSLDPA